MILGDRSHRQPQAQSSAGTPGPTLDDLFRAAAARRPDAIALIDPPDRASFTDGPARRLTYAEADRAIAVIAARLAGLGLSTDSVVAMQLPNTVEGVLTLLGILRAGMIAAPLPLLWRQSDAVKALARVGARALVTTRRVGEIDHGEVAMHVAAEVFTIRFVCAFGDDIADGLVPFDDVFDVAPPKAVQPPEREGHTGAHVAVVTFDITADGVVPVARSHAELAAGAMPVIAESGIGADAMIVAALMGSSFAGLAATVMPWLATGGTLALHHPFTPAVLAAQCTDERSDAVVLPGPLVGELVNSGLVERSDMSRRVIAVWRSPERLAGTQPWASAAPLTDVLAFGEVGLLAAGRNQDGKPAAIPLGAVTAPRGAADAPLAAEIARTTAGTLAFGGPMAARHAFPPGYERSGHPCLKVGEDGFVDTGYGCRVERETKAVVIGAPPAGIVTVGGYRFALKELQELIAGIEDGGTLAALPDALGGHRLAGVGSDRAAIREALIALGVNPLLVAAFRERRSGDRASAA